jgi:hypothetical protein
MARNFLVDVNLNKNELQNAVIQPLSSAPSSPVEGQIYYNTTDDTVYIRANSAWLDLGKQPTDGITDLATTLSATNTIITSSTGTDATIPAVDGTNAGVMTPTMKSKLDGIEALADVTDAANVDAAGAVMNSDTSTAAMGFVVDEDDMVSDSATKVPTQQSVKAYVDNAVQGLSWKQAVRAATTANITLSGTQTIDGVAVIAGDRVLVKDQTTGSQNGIYIVSASGWSRSADANSSLEIDSMAVLVESGTANAETVWTLTTDNPSLGSTSLVYAQINGGTVPVATTTTQGKVELATQAEAEAKSDGTRAVTPASLATFARKYTGLIGDGSATAIAVTHGLGSQYVTAQIFDASTNAMVDCDVTLTSSTQTTFTFAVAPTTNAYRVVITG